MRRFVAAIVLLLAVLGPARPAAAEDEATVRVLVRLDGRPSAALDQVLDDLADAGVDPDEVTAYDTIPWVAIDLPADEVDVLERSDGATEVVADGINHLSLDQTVPVVGADDLATGGIDGTGTTVAILDTGVQADHPFLDGRVVAEACFSHGDCDGGASEDHGAGSGEPCSISACRHGTHVAGIAAGRSPGGTSPSRGVAPGADIISLRVFTVVSGQAVAYDSDILAALDWVRLHADDYNIVAANLSLGDGVAHTSTCDSSEAAYDDIFGELRGAGVAPVVASGNEGYTNAISAPACVSSAISVTATTDGDAVASFSNVASFVDLAAPGVGVVSAVPGSTYSSLSGTSMATPHVAGAFALLRQLDSTIAVTDALTALQSSGVPVDDTVVSDIPRIDLPAAEAALTTPPDAPTAVTATAGTERATVSWTAPTGLVTGYRVAASPADVSEVTTTATSVTVTGLTAGTAYTFTVVAENAAGDSPASAPSEAVTPSRRRSGGGGGGGGGGSSSTRRTPAPTPTPTTVVTPAPPPRVLLPSSAVPVPGAIVIIRDGAPVSIPIAGGDFVAAASTPSGGAWAVTANGRVVATGGAPELGSITFPLNAPIVGMGVTPSGQGYWLLGADGGIFSFGDAVFHGSTGGIRLNQPVRAIATTPTGGGYWLLAADGGVFTFGDAGFLGSTGGMQLNQPVSAMASTATGDGYWLVSRDGGVFSFGSAAFAGAGSGGREVRALVPSPSGAGYWLLTADGAALPFGAVN